MTMFFTCDECGKRLTEEEILVVKIPHPRPRYGNPTVDVNQCPECGTCEQFTNACDEPGCTAEALYGWPSSDGYRYTCWRHYQG